MYFHRHLEIYIDMLMLRNRRKLYKVCSCVYIGVGREYSVCQIMVTAVKYSVTVTVMVTTLICCRFGLYVYNHSEFRRHPVLVYSLKIWFLGYHQEYGLESHFSSC